MKEIRKPDIICLIYCMGIMLFVLKAFFYCAFTLETGVYPPDEGTHVAYVVYLEETSAILPQFEKIKIGDFNTYHINGGGIFPR